MALIPYEHIPAPHDPPITVAGQPLQEFYCGDARCDCATAHVLFGGVPMTVDLGTVNVEPIQQQGQQQVTPAQQVLAQTLRQALSAGPIAMLRDHYAKVREFGREQHFRYVDWSGLKQGDLVAWEQVFRTESAPMWTMTPAAPESGKQGDAAQAEETKAGEEKGFLLGLGDSYCIEPRCDCQKVVWSVLTAPIGQPGRAQAIGTAELSFATGQPAVIRHAPSVQPNQIFALLHNLLRAQPQLVQMYQQRYALLRQHLSPILTGQRRERSEAHRQQTIGRNDPCPCGSGKKFKKCHGS